LRRKNQQTKKGNKESKKADACCMRWSDHTREAVAGIHSRREKKKMKLENNIKQANNIRHTKHTVNSTSKNKN
jgi:hypothetical protein